MDMDTPLRLPDFVMIGAPKCGTTDLAAILGDHPSIRISTDKEPMVFTRDDMMQGPWRFVYDTKLWERFDWETHRDSILREYIKAQVRAPCRRCLG